MTRPTPVVTAPAVTAPADAAPVDPADPPAPVAAPPPVRPVSRRTTACAVLTLAAASAAAVGPLPTRTWGPLLLSALVVGGGGWPLHRAAGTALRRGPCADVLPAAGLLVLLAAGLGAVLEGTALEGTAAVPLVAPAAATTLLLAGRDVVSRARRRMETGPAAALHHGETIAAVASRARHGADVLDRMADRATGGLACLVAGLAVATLGFWLGAGAGPVAALGAAAAVLLTACPRTIGRTASSAVLAATARAVTLGALPADPRVLERASRVDTVVLCRTGTVTRGVRELQAVHVAPGVDPEEALRLAGAVAAAAQEAGGPAGSHPVGAAVAQAARDRFGPLPGVAEFDGYPGLGVRGLVSELCAGPDDEPRVIAHASLVGRTALLAEHGIVLPPELADAVEQAHAAGTTAVAVSWDGVARAVLEVVDPVRPESAEVVRQLRGLGIAPLLLTGDDAGVARGAADVLGIDPEQVFAPVAPGARAGAVVALRAQGRTVAVLGGPDDAAALAEADVALVRAGESRLSTDSVAQFDHVSGPGAAAIMLREDDPLAAIDALRLARRAVRMVERTLTATVAAHLVALPAAAAGLLPPLAAAGIAAVLPAAAVLRAAALGRLRPVPRPPGG